MTVGLRLARPARIHRAPAEDAVREATDALESFAEGSARLEEEGPL